MPLRKAIYRLTAIGFTSTVLLSLSGIAANAATFNLSYKFGNSTALSALIEGELAENGSIVARKELPSALLTDILTDRTSNVLEVDPESLAVNDKVRLEGGLASLTEGARSHSEANAVGFQLFNNARVGQREFSFVSLVYQSSQGNVNFAEAFTYNALAFQKRDIPEHSSTSTVLIALAGLGIAAAKKHSRR